MTQILHVMFTPYIALNLITELRYPDLGVVFNFIF